MKKPTLAAAAVFAVSLLVSSFADPALAQGRGRGQDKNKDKAAKTDHAKLKDKNKNKAAKTDHAKTHVDREPRFGDRDRDVISRYYGRNSGLPPGLAKRDGDLPPGLEKQLRRNGTLPPGLQKKLRPLPVALERELPPLPHGFRRGVIDRHLVVYQGGTYRIADTIFDAVR